ncbi:hypothetical protein N7467_003082 [Penicillium canescens]|nr:hypothetical protein N7467_003082 [Penicillium canescens]
MIWDILLLVTTFSFRFGTAFLILYALKARRGIVTGAAAATAAVIGVIAAAVISVVTTAVIAAVVIRVIAIIIIASRLGLAFLALYTLKDGKGLVNAAIRIAI